MSQPPSNMREDAIKNMKARINNATTYSLIHRLARKQRNADRKTAWTAKNHGGRRHRKSRKNRHTKRRN